MAIRTKAGLIAKKLEGNPLDEDKEKTTPDMEKEKITPKEEVPPKKIN